MCPVPRGFIRRMASLVPWMTAWRLISSSRIAVASSSSSNGPIGMIPALLTSTSIGPSRRSTSSRNAVNPGRSVTSSASPMAPRAELCGRGLGGGGVDVADRHAATLARQRVRERLADAPSAAGDDGDLAVAASVAALPYSGILLFRRGVSEN